MGTFIVPSIIGYVQVGSRTAALVSPVLSSCWNDSNDGMMRTEDLLDIAMRDRTEAGDRAVVILLDYNIGAHNHEELTTNITQRGKAVLPHLLKYRDHRPLPLRPDFWLMRSSRKDHNEEFDDMIRLVKEGKVLQE